MQHYLSHWDWALSDNMRAALMAIMNRTNRFGQNRWWVITRESFFEGDAPNPANGYAGTAPLPPMSERTFSSIMATLVEYGIVLRDGTRYAIDYSVTALDLATREDVQKRVMAKNMRGGFLSTVEGIVRWATRIMERWAGSQEAVEGIPSTINPSTKNQDKSWSLVARAMRGLVMAKQSAEELKASILASVQRGRDAVNQKRKTRRTLADEVRLFDTEWGNGQRMFDPQMVPARIVRRSDIKLLKDHIILPFRNTDMDVVHFAHWVAANWGAIGAQHFAKAKSYPRYPAIRWLIACRDTYIQAYAHKDELDPTKVLSRSDVSKRAANYEKATAALQSTAQKFEAASADMQAQLEEAHAEIARLRKQQGLDEDDDPVYKRVKRIAKRKTTFGSFD
jgi:hypothetical protein